MEAPYSSQAFSGCAVADEQVEWVLVRVPVRSSGPSSFTSTPPMVDSSFPPYPAHPTTMWDQLPAGPLSPMPLTDPFPGQLESNIALALSLQASYPLACFDTDTSSSPVFHTGDLMPPCDTPFSDVFTSEAWQPAEQYISDTCSLDSPTTAASGTPCSTPPSPQTFLCSDPTCFEFFTRPADLKYDDPPSSSKSQVLTNLPPGDTSASTARTSAASSAARLTPTVALSTAISSPSTRSTPFSRASSLRRSAAGCATTSPVRTTFDGTREASTPA